MAVAFLYIVLVIKPAFYFHHSQAPFLLDKHFLMDYTDYPGGISEWISNLVMQGFYSRVAGPPVFFVMALCIYLLSRGILNRIRPDRFNVVLALLPFTFSIVIANNYTLPYQVIISSILVFLFTWIFCRTMEKALAGLLMILAGTMVIFYVSGTGYLLLYGILVLSVTLVRLSYRNVPYILFSFIMVAMIPFLAGKIVFKDLPPPGYLDFFREVVEFKAYYPSLTFYMLLISMPLLASGIGLYPAFKKITPGLKLSPVLKTIVMAGTILVFTAFSHFETFIPDARRIVASDYYCLHLDARKVAKAATNIENYHFGANLNYNLAMAKAGRLNEDFFNFFQVTGANVLYPDLEFSSELVFISADFYYDLGYICEARHWAYEALVFYPYSPRALRLLVKIHLVTGEYKAAERTLFILEKGIINRKFTREYEPLVRDTSLVYSNSEIMSGRRSMPGSHELDPYIISRFMELLEKNPENTRAYEYLMLYFILDGDLENFLEYYKLAGKYFDRPVGIYEEAILMYGFLNHIDVKEEYDISAESLARFDAYLEILEKHKNDVRMARNELYWKMGNTCLYYLQFVEPRVILPEITDPDHEEPQI